jgi:hypothetical protein
MVYVVETATHGMSQHHFRGLRRSAAIARNKQCLFQAHQSKLQSSWELAKAIEQTLTLQQIHADALQMKDYAINSLAAELGSARQESADGATEISLLRKEICTLKGEDHTLGQQLEEISRVRRTARSIGVSTFLRRRSIGVSTSVDPGMKVDWLVATALDAVCATVTCAMEDKVKEIQEELHSLDVISPSISSLSGGDEILIDDDHLLLDDLHMIESSFEKNFFQLSGLINAVTDYCQVNTVDELDVSRASEVDYAIDQWVLERDSYTSVDSDTLERMFTTRKMEDDAVAALRDGVTSAMFSTGQVSFGDWIIDDSRIIDAASARKAITDSYAQLATCSFDLYEKREREINK